MEKKKELKDYLKFYIGCECSDTFNDCNITLTPMAYAGYMEHWEKPEDGQVKPILRPLSSMTEDEYLEAHEIGAAFNEENRYELMQSMAAVTQYLLSKGFDLFGLIESNLAISSTLQTEK